MKGNTIASRARRRLEIKARKEELTSPPLTGWMKKTDANIDCLGEEVTQSKLPEHTLCRVIEQRKSGKKTGLIALARVR